MTHDRSENFNVRKAHEAFLEEKTRPAAEREILPVWVVVFLWLLAFWVGGYLIRYNGGFRADVFDEKLSLESAVLTGPLTSADLLVLGKRSFSSNCVACHQTTGLGVPNQYPPLVGSEFALGPPIRVIPIVLHGLEGAVKVKGETYNGAMPAWKDALTDAQIAGILTYVRASWGNQAGPVTPEEVKALREKYKDRTESWREAELRVIPEAEEGKEAGEEPAKEAGKAGKEPAKEPAQQDKK